MNRDEHIAEGIVRLQNAIDEEAQNVRELAADLARHIQAYGATGNETIDNLVFELTINARNMDESDLIDSAQELIYAFDDFLFEEYGDEEEDAEGYEFIEIMNEICSRLSNRETLNDLSNRETLNDTTIINELFDALIEYMDEHGVDMNEVVSHITESLRDENNQSK